MKRSEKIIGNSRVEIERAAEVLRSGGLVAFPTETVYGLGADASNLQAVERIFSAKRRPRNHPLIVHLADAGHVDRWARDIPPVTWRLVERFWPGPLTLILPCAPGVLKEVTGGQETVGLRVPAHPAALDLLKAFGGGVAAPSANGFGRLSPTSAEHVVAELDGAVDCVIDGGFCTVGIESTILDLSGAKPRILRPGEIKPGDLAEVLGEIPGGRTPDAPRAPGGTSSHYAPATPLLLVEPDVIESTLGLISSEEKTVAVLSFTSTAADQNILHWWRMPADPMGYARLLYQRLRQADSTGSRFILVEKPPSGEDWEAVHDRLRRASCEGQDKGESP